MRFHQLARVAAAGLLLSLSGYLFAQGTMESRTGSRHAGPNAVSGSTATFAVGVTRDNGASFVSSAGINDTVEIRGEIRPEADDINQPADIFVVDRLIGGSFLMLDQSGAWIPWNVSVDTLVPFREGVLLHPVEPVEMFTGALTRAGEHALFLGYLPPDGPLRYHTKGLLVTITETSTQSPREQAKALFASTIHPNIVQSNCIACHIPGNPDTAGVHQFVQGSGQVEIDTNFEKFANMISRGKDYILGKVRGDSLHLGGPVLPRNASGYSDFELFLTLLEQP